MKITKTLTTIVIGTVCMTAICSCSAGESGSSKKDRDKDKDEETKVTASEVSSAVDPGVEPAVTVELCELPQGEVIIYKHSDNYAEGYQASDIFVMSDGSVYASEEFFTSCTEEYFEPLADKERLQLLMLSSSPVAQFDVDALTEVYSLMQYADPNEEFVYEDEVTYDGGYSYTAVNVGGEWVKISEGGVYTGWLEDDYAGEALQIIRDEFSKLSMAAPAHIYSKDITFLKTYELGDADVKPCKMLITDMEELRAFDEMTGIDLEGNECLSGFGDPEYDSFNSMCIAVEIVAYDEVFGLDTVSTDAFVVSESYVGFSPLTSLKMATTSLRLGTDKYYCYVAVLPAYDMSVYEGFEE